MKIERFKSVAIQIEELCETEFQIRRKQTCTTTGSNTWARYMKQIEEVRTERLTLWEEIRQAIYGQEARSG